MPRALLHDPVRGAWLAFDAPLAEYRVDDHATLTTVLASAVSAAESRGLWAVVMLSYESSPAFDPSFSTHPMNGFPLAWVALFESPRILTSLPPAARETDARNDRWLSPAATAEEDRPFSPRELPHDDAAAPPDARWNPSIDIASYGEAIRRIREHIARGDTYQVNFTFRLRRKFARDPYPLFHALASRPAPPFAAYLDLGPHVVCSLSPELFFRLDGDRLVSRPMKGTSPRGMSSDDDLLAADRLRRSPKNRAENIMVVDMVRNDMGRVAKPGTVTVTRMYDIEQYPTVWQMTSTVEARTDAAVPEVLAALFPPASITGAPKVRTMQIIRELEESPRRVYTGSIGWIAPGGSSQFSVAIRTLLVDRTKGEAEYGVGGGIVWDSNPAEEYQECITKSALLDARGIEFSLLETMLWTPDAGFALLGDHLARLRSSARYFGVSFDEASIRKRLADAVLAGGGSGGQDAPADPAGRGNRSPSSGVGTNPSGHLRVRLLLSPDGTATIESAPLQPLRAEGPPRVRLAPAPVDPRDPFLYHKTTHRAAYDRVRAMTAECEDVILWNPMHEITESCLANVVADIDGELVTPPVACGLLAGVARARMLRDGTVRERIILVDDLLRAERIFLTNAVRGIYPALLLREG